MANKLMNLTPCRVCSEVYRGFFSKAGLLSLSFRHLKGNWWYQSSTAVNINKFSFCNSQASLNIIRAVFFFPGVDIRSISERQFKISNGPVTIIQEPQKRRRVFIDSDDEEQCWFRLRTFAPKFSNIDFFLFSSTVTTKSSADSVSILFFLPTRPHGAEPHDNGEVGRAESKNSAKLQTTQFYLSLLLADQDKRFKAS